MPEDTSGEKVLPPSERKLQRLRDEGQVAKSQDLNTSALLLMSLAAAYLFGNMIYGEMLYAMELYTANASSIVLTSQSLQAHGYAALTHLAAGLLPFMLFLMGMGIAINVVQIGPLFSAQAIAPKLQRLNPAQGFQRFFSLRSLVELVKSLTKLTIIVSVVVITAWNQWDDFQLMFFLTPQGIIREIVEFAWLLWLRIALVMLLLGIADFLYQRWQFQQDQRMTMREARDELKELEGDPRIKQRVRQLQRQMAMSRMMAEVPEADVIITNPLTYAVALRYDPNQMEAPRVVAKGARLIANRIRETAIEHDVPIVERPPLARTLFRSTEVGDTIPEDLYRTVAEVLAFVYRIDRRADKQRERAEAAHAEAATA